MATKKNSRRGKELQKLSRKTNFKFLPQKAKKAAFANMTAKGKLFKKAKKSHKRMALLGKSKV